ncbi:malto-oligosyltrehalose synthase [Teichococcus aestuarii]|uniref:hypothetical protein n=1 Tax=Teichococcus aestuarii TaxID=568898 RepID=UPI003618FFFB
MESAYARFFDIDWNSDDPTLKGRMLAPFLGRPYGEALAEGELRLVKEGPTGLAVAYFDNRFPIAPRDAESILEDRDGLAEHDTKSLTGAARLHALLERQNYRLAWWRTATDEINWRRFFDVTGLAGLRAEEPEVFDATHELILRLYAEGLIDGVRIDHVDGTADPGGYCRKLRRRMESAGHRRPAGAPSGPPYILIEKILAPGERLETRWQTDGTTGYDFMDQVSAVLHDTAGEAPLSALWREASGSEADFHAEEFQARKQILRDSRPPSWMAAPAPCTTWRAAICARAISPSTPSAGCWRSSWSTSPSTVSMCATARRRRRMRRCCARRPRPPAPASSPPTTRRSATCSTGWPRSRCASGRRARAAAPCWWRARASSSSPPPPPPSRWRTRPSTATAGCSRATRWAPTPATSPCRRRPSTP